MFLLLSICCICIYRCNYLISRFILTSSILNPLYGIQLFIFPTRFQINQLQVPCWRLISTKIITRSMQWSTWLSFCATATCIQHACSLHWLQVQSRCLNRPGSGLWSPLSARTGHNNENGNRWQQFYNTIYQKHVSSDYQSPKWVGQFNVAVGHLAKNQQGKNDSWHFSPPLPA